MLRAEFGRPTFVFKSYSFAQAYPACYTADDPADLELITRDTYLDDWIGVVSELEPALRRARSAAWSRSCTPRAARSTGS